MLTVAMVIELVMGAAEEMIAGVAAEQRALPLLAVILSANDFRFTL